MATTGTLWGGGTPATTTTDAGAPWNTPTNATGANDNVRATWGSLVADANGTIRVEGHGTQAAIGETPTSVESVAVTVYAYVSNVSRIPTIEVQLTDAGTLIGSPQPMTSSATTSFSQTFTFTGVTWAQLANLGVRVSFTRAAVATTGIAQVDAVAVNASYTPPVASPLLSAYPGVAYPCTTYPSYVSGSGVPSGTASGTFTFEGAASGSTTKQGVASGTFTFTGSAAGTTTRSGFSTGSFAFTGAATGSTVKQGTASGTFAFTGSAVGSAPTLGANTGATTGAWQFTGSAVGSAPGVPPNTGAASGAWTFTGAAAGSTLKTGVSSGTWTFAGAATGTVPLIFADVDTPASRTLTIHAEDRTRTVPLEDRQRDVAANPRTRLIAPEDRHVTVPAETRERVLS